MGGFSVFYSHKEIDSDSDLKEKNIFNSLALRRAALWFVSVSEQDPGTSRNLYPTQDSL